MLFNRPELDLSGPLVPETKRHLDIGARFLYNPLNDWRWILRSGRSMNLALGVVLGFLVWRWSRELFGAGGAFVSLSLYCLSPVVISNSSLAAVDIMASPVVPRRDSRVVAAAEW